MTYLLQKAELTDIDEIAELIAASVQGLAADVYSPRQIELSIKTVFGVDEQLIEDGTYYVAVTEGAGGRRIAGCGGWSKRKTLYGASIYAGSRDPDVLDPVTDAAKIRAFFIHPDFARKGIGTAILDACEAEAKAAGFTRGEMMATLPGVKLYRVRGYTGDESVAVPVGEGETVECVRMEKLLN